MQYSDPVYDHLDAAHAQRLELENSQLRARLREVVALMENDILLGHVVAGQTRKAILLQSRELVPVIRT